MPPIRRLTVLQDTSSDDERPAWQWTLIGVLFAQCIWVPLAMLALWVVGRALPPGEGASLVVVGALHDRLWLWLCLTAPPILTYAFSCWAAGALVGRFGGSTGPKDTALMGALATLVACAITSLAGVPFLLYLAALVVLLPFGVGGGWLGGRFGVRLRTASATRAPPPAAH
jgi:hypothetical protein